MLIQKGHLVAVLPSGETLDWNRMWADIQVNRDELAVSGQRVAVCCDCSYRFLVALLVVLKSGSQLVLLPNGLPVTLQRYRAHYDRVLTQNDIVMTMAQSFEQQGQDLVLDDEAKIVFYTSGSSGAPKQVVKNVRSLFAEIADTSTLVQYRQSEIVISTVPHQHLYGLLFKIIASLFNQIPFYSQIIRYPSEMSRFAHFVLISSPAFLSRLDQSDAIDGADRVLSSGGPLSLEAGKRVQQIFGCQGYEIFGSTETGGIAYRGFSEAKIFTPLAGVKVRANDDGQLQLASSYLLNDDWQLCDDRVEIAADGRFSLLGRSDDVIKIEEKRTSLKEISNAISGLSPHIRDTYVASYRSNNRLRLAALVVADVDSIPLPPEAFAESLGADLRAMIDPIFVPKAWRVTADLQLGEMGKISAERILQEVLNHG